MIETKTKVIPALPVFQEAFSAFAQGTLIQTTNGQVAIEDLAPGTKVVAGEGKSEVVQWIGSMTIFPSAADLDLPEASIYRLTDGGYGLDRGTPDLMLGPSARILPGVLATDSSSPLKDISEMADGHSVIEIKPMSPVRVFHIGLASHRLIRANGVLVESFHPGPNARLHLSHELFEIFMSLFPHLVDSGDFGPLNHRRMANAA